MVVLSRISVSTVATVLIGLFIFGCSSAPVQKNGAEQDVAATKVLERIDQLEKRPDWLKESEPFKIENGKVLSLGQTVIPGDNRVEAAYRIAENNAKSSVSGAIENKMAFVFQNAEEGTGLDTTQARYIGGEVSNLVSSSLRVSKRYWEKVSIATSTNERMIQYRVFSLVEMPESDFKTAILNAARKRQGKGGLSPEFAKKVDQQWDKLVEADATAPQPKKSDEKE